MTKYAIEVTSLDSILHGNDKEKDTKAIHLYDIPVKAGIQPWYTVEVIFPGSRLRENDKCRDVKAVFSPSYPRKRVSSPFPKIPAFAEYSGRCLT